MNLNVGIYTTVKNQDYVDFCIHSGKTIVTFVLLLLSSLKKFVLDDFLHNRKLDQFKSNLLLIECSQCSCTLKGKQCLQT